MALMATANPPGGGMFDLGSIRRVSGLAVSVMFGICFSLLGLAINKLPGGH